MSYFPTQIREYFRVKSGSFASVIIPASILHKNILHVADIKYIHAYNK